LELLLQAVSFVPVTHIRVVIVNTFILYMWAKYAFSIVTAAYTTGSGNLNTVQVTIFP